MKDKRKTADDCKVFRDEYLPSLEEGMYPFVGFSRSEYMSFLDSAVAKSIDAITETERLLQNYET